MKKQVLFINGGEAFDTYDAYINYLKNSEFDPKKEKEKKWRNSLEERLGSDFEVIMPTMPNRSNAKYKEWKIWLEKTFPYLKDNIVLVGHSLGGIFLAKYLSENDFPKKILATYLIAPPYNDRDVNSSLADFVLPATLEGFARQGGQIYIYHSEDDSMVPLADIEKYVKALPKAKRVIFKEKGHFIQEEFPEIIDSIQRLYR